MDRDDCFTSFPGKLDSVFVKLPPSLCQIHRLSALFCWFSFSLVAGLFVGKDNHVFRVSCAPVLTPEKVVLQKGLAQMSNTGQRLSIDYSNDNSDSEIIRIL